MTDLNWRKNNPDKRKEQKKREKIRSSLRKKGILPPFGEKMTEEQVKINDLISTNDFSFLKEVNKKEVVETNVNIKSPEYVLWYRAKWKAKEKNIPFNLEVSDIELSEYCEVTTVRLTYNFDDRNKDNYFIIDRINWNQGYHKKNIRIVSCGSFKSKDRQEFYSRDFVPYHLEQEIYLKIKKKSISENLDFNIERTDIFVPTFCPYLGITLSYDKKNNKKNYYYSIDMIDNSLGYVKDNVQIISKLAKNIKNILSNEELILFSENIIKIHKK